jgi:hypothetical protein
MKLIMYPLVFILLNIWNYHRRDKPSMEIWLISRSMGLVLLEESIRQFDDEVIFVVLWIDKALASTTIDVNNIDRAYLFSFYNFIRAILIGIRKGNLIKIRVPHLSRYLMKGSFSVDCRRYFLPHTLFYEDGLTARLNNPEHRDLYPKELGLFTGWDFACKLTLNVRNPRLLSIKNLRDRNVTPRNLGAEHTKKVAHFVGSKYFMYDYAYQYFAEHFPNHKIVFYPHPNSAKNPSKSDNLELPANPYRSLEIYFAEKLQASDILVCGVTSVALFIKELGKLNKHYDIPVYLFLPKFENYDLTINAVTELEEYTDLMTNTYQNVFHIHEV